MSYPATEGNVNKKIIPIIVNNKVVRRLLIKGLEKERVILLFFELELFPRLMDLTIILYTVKELFIICHLQENVF